MYAPVALMGLLISLGLVLPQWTGLLIASASLAIGLYLDYTMVPLWVGISAIWFTVWYPQNGNIRNLLVWFISSVVAWGIFLPWLPRMYNMLDRVNDVVFFNRIQSMVGLPAFSATYYLVGLLLACVIAIVSSYTLSHLFRNRTIRRMTTPLVLLVYVIAIALFAVPRFYSIKRILVTGWSFIILFTAWLIVHFQGQRQRIWQGLLILSMLSSLIVLLTPKDDWRSVATYFEGRELSDDVIWVDPGWDKVAYNYYDPGQDISYGKLVDLKEVAEQAEIWLIAERYMGQPVPSSDSEIWLNENLNLLETISFYRLEVRHYRP
jgi:hypothetical protein